MTDRLMTDLRYALRLFARTPVWTAAAILSLSLGMGVNLLIFSIVDAVLLHPFPYRDPSQLVFIWGTKNDTVRRGISGLDLADWQARNQSFESLDAFLGQMSFTVGDEWGSGGRRVHRAFRSALARRAAGAGPELPRGRRETRRRHGGDRQRRILADADGGFGLRDWIDAALERKSLRGRRRHTCRLLLPRYRHAGAGVDAVRGAELLRTRRGLRHAVGRLRPGVTAAQAEGRISTRSTATSRGSILKRIATSRPACSLSGTSSSGNTRRRSG